MKKIRIFKVKQRVYGEEDFELAVCTTEKYAEKAIDRLVTENCEDKCSLYIVEDEIILDAIYGWDDGDLEA